jgi:REP element-mobilizing transposase RayT
MTKTQRHLTQLSFIPKPKWAHGGEHAIGRRHSRRPLDSKKPIHLVLRSDIAKGSRSLLQNRALVERLLKKYSGRYHVRVYEKAICGNHIHLLVRAKQLRQLQNFFRVFAGQVAQEILRLAPKQKQEAKAYWGGTHPKNQKSFWSYLLYTRLVSWGREYRAVKAYVIQNLEEVLGLRPYTRNTRANRAGKNQRRFIERPVEV